MTARKKAYQLLIDICIHKKYSHLALKDGMGDVSEQDKALISTLVYGTLQNYRYLDYQWKGYCEKWVKKEIEILMNMSVFQLLFLDRIPAFAVTNEAVEIAKGKYDGKFVGFVNAILRKVISNGKRPLEGNEAERLALETSFPLWVVKMWNKQYGESVCRNLCLDAQQTPSQALRVNTIKTAKMTLLESRDCYEVGRLSPDALRYQRGSVVGDEDFVRGYVTVQDEASQMVGYFLAPEEGENVLDMCSAPGSKTAHMAALMNNRGKIIALDVHAHRVELVKATMRRLGCINVDALVCDAIQAGKHLPLASFDKLLLDAPCTGYGVLKHKSDIKYHMQSEDMDPIIKIQKQLLDEAPKLLKVDGVMVYSTCTLNKKENELQIQSFLERYPNFVLMEERTIFPYEYDTDGFYMAKLKKVS